MTNPSRQGGPDTLEPDPTAERPIKEKQGNPFEETETPERPEKMKPQVPDVNPPVQPGHRDREQI